MKRNFAVLTGDELGIQIEYFEHRHEAENWAELLHGSMHELNTGIDATEMIRARRIEKGVAKYESKESRSIEI